MLTSKQILDLATNDPSVAGYQGLVQGLKRFTTAGPSHLPGADPRAQAQLPTSHQRLLAEAEQRANETPRRQLVKYNHPEQDPRGASLAQRRDVTGQPATHELSAVDIAWLTRLPADPSEVSYEDAVHLASLARTPIADRSAARLVQSIWQPVKEVCDTRAAEADLSNVKQQTSRQVPAYAAAALADVLRAEHPELTEAEADSRADALLAQTGAGINVQHQAAEQEAQATIDAVATATAARTSPTKVT